MCHKNRCGKTLKKLFITELDGDFFLFSRLELLGELQRLIGVNLNLDLPLCSIDHVHFPKLITNSLRVLMSAEMKGNALEVDPKRHRRRIVFIYHWLPTYQQKHRSCGGRGLS